MMLSKSEKDMLIRALAALELSLNKSDMMTDEVQENIDKLQFDLEIKTWSVN